MSARTQKHYLSDMLEAAQTSLRYMAGRRRSDLDEDSMLRDAVVRQLEILGEAASQVTEATRAQYPEVPWRSLVGMRNVRIHAYHRVDHEEIWNTITEDLPDLLRVLERMASTATGLWTRQPRPSKLQFSRLHDRVHRLTSYRRRSAVARFHIGATGPSRMFPIGSRK